EPNLQRPAVFPNVIGNSGTRNGDGLVPPQHPGQSYLGRSGIVARSYFLQHWIAKHSALLNRRVRHNRYVAINTPGEQVILDTAAGEVVENLIRGYVCSARQVNEFLHIGDVEIAYAPVANFAG